MTALLLDSTEINRFRGLFEQDHSKISNLQLGFNVLSEFADVGAEVVNGQRGGEYTVDEGARTIAAGARRGQDKSDGLLLASLGDGFLAHVVLAQGFQVASERAEVPIVDDLTDAILITAFRSHLGQRNPIVFQFELDANCLVDAAEVGFASGLVILNVLARGNAQTRIAGASLGKIVTALAHIRAETRLARTHHQGTVIVSGTAVASQGFIVNFKRNTLGGAERLYKGLLLDGVLAESLNVGSESLEIPVSLEPKGIEETKICLNASICLQH